MGKKKPAPQEATETPTQPTWLRDAGTDAPIRLKAGPKLDRDAVDLEKGIIKGLSAITKGEALGHYGFIDDEFIDAVVAAGKKWEKDDIGALSFYTHGSWSSDRLPDYLGRTTSFVKDEEGPKARCDLTVMPGALKEKRDQVLNLAATDPTACGASIVFYRDWDAEMKFMDANSVMVGERKVFKSPDKKNPRNLPHWRLRAIESVDIVAFPAANPDGVFSQGQSREQQVAEAVLSVIEGNADADALEKIGIDVEQFTQYVKDHVNKAGLQVLTDQEVETMSTANKDPETPKAEPKVEASIKPVADDPAIAELKAGQERLLAELAEQKAANKLQADIIAAEQRKSRISECRATVTADWASLSGMSIPEKAELLAALQDGAALSKEQGEKVIAALNAASKQLGEKPISTDPEAMGDGQPQGVVEELAKAIALKQKEDPKLDYTAALLAVRSENKELARRYDKANIRVIH